MLNYQRVPLNHPFPDGIFHYKPTIFGDPPFMETPISNVDYLTFKIDFLA
jgi:hypothetical protein